MQEPSPALDKAGPQSAAEILVNWANGEQNWVRGIVRDIMATRQPLSESALEEAYDQCLIERELKQGEVREVAKLELTSAAGETIERLELLSLKQVQNVNRLAPEQEIVFNPRMTVLFGENATGKSGYVRILKRMAAVRSEEEILPDVSNEQAKGGPMALVKFRLNGADGELHWKGESGARPFDRMSAFDTRAMAFHVDNDLTYVYTPRDLAWFQYVYQAIKAIGSKLETARDASKAKSNPFLENYNVGSIVYAKIESLSAATDLSLLEKLGDVSPEEENQVPILRDNVEALKPKIVQMRLEVAQNDRDIVNSVRSAVQKVSSFDWEVYNQRVKSVRAAEAEYQKASVLAFEDSGIPGVLTNSWQQFISAGAIYSAEFKRTEEHADHTDRCPYCRQELNDSALDLLRRYRDYTTSTLKSVLDNASDDLLKVTSLLSDLDIQRLTSQVNKKIAAGSSETPAHPIMQAALVFLQKVPLALDSVQIGADVNAEDLISDLPKLIENLNKACAEIDTVIDNLTRQGTDRARQHAEQTALLRDLEDRLTLRKQLPKIKEHVEKAKWAEQANTIARDRFPPLLRSLTKQQKLASEDLLNQDFERFFRAECEALRAPKVRLQFPGRGGETARRKSIVADHRLSDVLSEGEQKVIAMSDFLAEASIRTGSSPLLFDDPVNSLDYRRLEYIVERLHQLSSLHQVVIFTHNIWFATALLAKFDKDPDGCTYYSVERDRDGRVGLVTRGNHPRWDTVSELTKRINENVNNAGSTTGETRQALIESTYSRIRSWCEVVTEQELLQGVAQRYKPNVMMTALPKIKPDRLAQATEVIFRIFEKACRITEAHSQPLETLGIQATLEDLKNDWNEAKEARNAYKA